MVAASHHLSYSRFIINWRLESRALGQGQLLISYSAPPLFNLQYCLVSCVDLQDKTLTRPVI
jgi:hypothetical protein